MLSEDLVVLPRVRYLGTPGKWSSLLLSVSPDLQRLPGHLPQSQVWSTDSWLPDFKTLQGSQLHPAEHGFCVQRARARHHSPTPFPRPPERQHPCQSHGHSLQAGRTASFLPWPFRTCDSGDGITPPGLRRPCHMTVSPAVPACLELLSPISHSSTFSVCRDRTWWAQGMSSGNCPSSLAGAT